MDEVLANYTLKVLQVLKKETGYDLKFESIKGKFLSKWLPEEFLEIVTSYPYRQGWFADLEAMEGSCEVMEKLYQKYEVYIVTSAIEFPYAAFDKNVWLKKNFPFIDNHRLVISNHKHIINGNLLIDDNPKHLRNFPNQKLLFTAFHNVNINAFERVNNWSDIESRLL